ncbi:MAG: hypothetical protein AB8H80_15050 [Planctomycetota bacterium]
MRSFAAFRSLSLFSSVVAPAALAAAVLTPDFARAQDPAGSQPRAAAPIVVKVGTSSYDWDLGWGRPVPSTSLAGDAPADTTAAKTTPANTTAAGKTVEIGNTHGCLVVRSNGNILANTDTEHAVVEFSPEGRIVQTWGKEFRGGLHGMCHRVEAGQEVLYLAHTRRHEVVKATIDGKVLWTIGWPKQSGVYEKEGQYKPTAVAVAPDGRIFVGDGYGKSWVHVYDKDRNYVKSFGGRGQQDGKFVTPHGLWLDDRAEKPLLCVCDRENHRLQWFTLDGVFVRKMDKGLRRPCNVWPLRGGGLVVADLAGRITFLDSKDQVVGHVGDNPDPKLRAKNGIPRAQWRDGEFLSPHSVCVDAKGNVYVMDWNSLGRISRLVPKG